MILNKYSVQKSSRILYTILQPGFMSFGIAVVLYGLIFWSINRGVSIDEGYYLLGYLADQPMKHALSDFHYIVRSLSLFLPEDNALSLRFIRVVITLLALYYFSTSTYKWLKGEYSIKINKFSYFSLSYLTGTLCFAYASPVLYYDNIEMILYLISFSLVFEILNTKRPLLGQFKAFLLGFLVVFALTNYFPAGVFLLFASIVILIIYLQPFNRLVLPRLFFILFGLAVGSLFYNLFIHNIFYVLTGLVEMYYTISKFADTKYDTGGQLHVLIRYFTNILITTIPIIFGSVVYFYLRMYIRKYAIIVDTVFLLATGILIYKLSSFYTNILLLPIVVFISYQFLENRTGLKQMISLKAAALSIIIITVPLLGVLGSNQLLACKMLYFMPFWFLALFILMAQFKTFENKFQYNKFSNLLIMSVSIVFVFQGFLKHPHYNYSIKKSKYPVENASRFKGIKVSEYQNKFYENGIIELTNNGFRPGDQVLCFYETFMLAYMAGGYIPGGLIYWAYLFASDPDNIPKEKIKYIIIDESEIDLMKDFLSQTNWEFPDSYKRTDLGTDGQNLTQMGYNYVLYSAHP